MRVRVYGVLTRTDENTLKEVGGHQRTLDQIQKVRGRGYSEQPEFTEFPGAGNAPEDLAAAVLEGPRGGGVAEDAPELVPQPRDLDPCGPEARGGGGKRRENPGGS